MEEVFLNLYTSKLLLIEKAFSLHPLLRTIYSFFDVNNSCNFTGQEFHSHFFPGRSILHNIAYVALTQYLYNTHSFRKKKESAVLHTYIMLLYLFYLAIS